MKEIKIENVSKKNQRIAKAAAEHAYNNRRWTYNSIWEAYERPSAAKVAAWDYCRDMCKALGGWDMIISSKNTSVFSVVFTFAEPSTGAICYAYITRDYDRFCYA